MTSGILSNKLRGHSIVIRFLTSNSSRSPRDRKYPARTVSASHANAERPNRQEGPCGRWGFPGAPVESVKWYARVSVLQLGE